MASQPDPPKQSTGANGARGPDGAGAEQNSLTPESTAADRSRKIRSQAADQTENALRPRRARIRAQATEDLGSKRPTERPGAPDTDSRAVPAHIHARYIKVGNQYHFTNGDLAFADRGRGLSTRLENTEVIRDLIAIAQERGWNDVALKGTERFRKEAWQQANLAGITVRGYTPSELERAQLVRLIGRERGEGRDEPSARATAPSDRPESRSTVAEEAARADSRASAHVSDRVHAGRLIDHGTANYQHDRHADLSYFVTMDTPDGERTLWGKDLQRALEHSLSRAAPGDEVVVRQLGAKPVTVVRPIRDEEGRIVNRTHVQTHLNRWSVERADFLKEREQVAQIVRDPSVDAKTGVAKRPELAGTYAELHAAKLIAQELFTHSADRDRFITRVREAIADEIERGEPLSAPRVRNRAQDHERDRSRTPERAQERVLN